MLREDVFANTLCDLCSVKLNRVSDAQPRYVVIESIKEDKMNVVLTLNDDTRHTTTLSVLHEIKEDGKYLKLIDNTELDSFIFKIGSQT